MGNVRRGIAAIAVWCLVACSGVTRGTAADPVDLVITGGRIFTGDPVAPWAEALAIRDDRIVAVGEGGAMGRFRAARTIDVGGRLVIPGINDAHVHEPSVIDFVDATRNAAGFDAASAADLVDRVAEAARAQPAGVWIRGELNRAAIDEPSLTRRSLDHVAPRHPVWIDNFAGHALLLNSAAERALGLEDRAPPPPGGFRGRDHKGGSDGWRFEYARYDALRRLGGRASDADIERAARAFAQGAAALGITTVQTLPTELEPARLVEVLRRIDSPIRWRVMRLPVGAITRPPGSASPDPAARVSFTGTKYFLDGTPVERGAALRAPYSDRPGWSGRLDWSRDDVKQMLADALATGDQLHLHVEGDASLGLVLDMMDATGGAGAWRDQRLVLEHGDGLGRADYARAKALGVVVVQNPSHTMFAELIRTRVGDRVNSWMPMRSLVAAGIPLAIGSDGPLNPYLNIQFATVHPTNPDEALTREQALVAYTYGAAYDERLEAAKGRLAPGMVADLAVLSQDLFRVDASQLPATRSVLTIVGGRIVHDKLSR